MPGQRSGRRPSEVRIRVAGVEVAVSGESREDCLRQLERAVQDVEAEGATCASTHSLPEARYRVTPAGAAYLQGYREGQGDGR